VIAVPSLVRLSLLLLSLGFTLTPLFPLAGPSTRHEVISRGQSIANRRPEVTEPGLLRSLSDLRADVQVTTHRIAREVAYYNGMVDEIAALEHQLDQLRR
jgi:hypothetical protein